MNSDGGRQRCGGIHADNASSSPKGHGQVQNQERESWWSVKVDGITVVHLSEYFFNRSFQIAGLLSVDSQAAFSRQLGSFDGAAPQVYLL